MSQQEQNVIVLVADDEPSTLALVASHVRGKGYKVLEASDGDQAWQLAHEHLPDLVILDVMMPGMSGWEVCRKIREAVSLAHTGVIMLTGIGENLNEMTSPLYGADTYLDKPFEFSTLDEKVVETLAERRGGAMGRPDPEVAARKSSHPPAPKSNGVAAAKRPKREKAAASPKEPSVERAAAMPLVKAPREASSTTGKAAKPKAKALAQAKPGKAAKKKGPPPRGAKKKAAKKKVAKAAKKAVKKAGARRAAKAAPKRKPPKGTKAAAKATGGRLKVAKKGQRAKARPIAAKGKSSATPKKGRGSRKATPSRNATL